jgi:hypothetical protein
MRVLMQMETGNLAVGSVACSSLVAQLTIY